jgi:hypothetical protein
LVVIHFFDNTDKTDITVLFELGTNFELFWTELLFLP